MNYKPTPTGDEVRREIGDIISDLPSKAIKDLLAMHAITEVEETPAPTGEPVATTPVPDAPSEPGVTA